MMPPLTPSTRGRGDTPQTGSEHELPTKSQDPQLEQTSGEAPSASGCRGWAPPAALSPAPANSAKFPTPLPAAPRPVPGAAGRTRGSKQQQQQQPRSPAARSPMAGEEEEEEEEAEAPPPAALQGREEEEEERRRRGRKKKAAQGRPLLNAGAPRAERGAGTLRTLCDCCEGRLLGSLLGRLREEGGLAGGLKHASYLVETYSGSSQTANSGLRVSEDFSP